MRDVSSRNVPLTGLNAYGILHGVPSPSQLSADFGFEDSQARCVLAILGQVRKARVV